MNKDKIFMILDNWLMIMDILLIFGDVERKHKKKRYHIVGKKVGSGKNTFLVEYIQAVNLF